MDEAQTQPRAFDDLERIRITRSLHNMGLAGVLLPGLTTTRQPCHGYANGCR